MKKYITLFFVGPLLGLTDLMACPYCASMVQGSENDKTVYVLGAFVIFTYIPGYFVYRLIRKYKKLEEALNEKNQVQATQKQT